MFSSLSGLLIIVTALEKTFPLCLESKQRNSSTLPTKSLGGTGLLLVVVQMSAVGRPMLGKKEVHSAAAALSCDGPVDPRPLLPRTEASPLGSPAEVPAMSLCILSTVPSHCSDLHTACTQKYACKTSHYAVDLLQTPVAACAITQLLHFLVRASTKRGINHLFLVVHHFGSD